MAVLPSEFPNLDFIADRAQYLSIELQVLMDFQSAQNLADYLYGIALGAQWPLVLH